MRVPNGKIVDSANWPIGFELRRQRVSDSNFIFVSKKDVYEIDNWNPMYMNASGYWYYSGKFVTVHYYEAREIVVYKYETEEFQY